MKTKTLGAILSLSIAVGFASSAFADVNPAKVQQLIKGAGVFAKGYDTVWPTVTGETVEIKVNKNPKDSDNDLKINALLAGKAVMDADPHVNLVRVVYREGVRNSVGSVDEKDTMVDATRANVLAYAAGVVDKSQLLGGMHFYVNVQAATTQAVIEKSAGPGPLQSARMNLINEFYMKTGKEPDMLHDIVPTVDKYAGELQDIQSQAHRGVEKGLRDRIINLDQAFRRESEAFRRLPQEEQVRQQMTYMSRHGIRIPRDFATQLVGVRTGDGTVLSPRDFIRLAPKYPDFTPDSSVKLQLARRQQIGLKLMLLAENHQAIQKEWSDQFASAEKLAHLNDATSLETKLSWLERSLGLPRLSIMTPTQKGSGD